jgi:putative ATP-dependent endonuclease of OLD family
MSSLLLAKSELRNLSNNKKKSWKQNDIAIFDCDEGLCLEQQLFKSMPWEGVQELLQYAQDQNKDSFQSAFPKVKKIEINKWIDSSELREGIISIFKPTKNNKNCGKEWFKAIHHGEFIGQTIFKYYQKLEQESGLKMAIKGLNDWVDEVGK